MLQKLL